MAGVTRVLRELQSQTLAANEATAEVDALLERWLDGNPVPWTEARLKLHATDDLKKNVVQFVAEANASNEVYLRQLPDLSFTTVVAHDRRRSLFLAFSSRALCDTCPPGDATTLRVPLREFIEEYLANLDQAGLGVLCNPTQPGCAGIELTPAEVKAMLVPEPVPTTAPGSRKSWWPFGRY